MHIHIHTIRYEAKINALTGALYDLPASLYGYLPTGGATWEQALHHMNAVNKYTHTYVVHNMYICIHTYTYRLCTT